LFTGSYIDGQLHGISQMIENRGADLIYKEWNKGELVKQMTEEEYEFQLSGIP